MNHPKLKLIRGGKRNATFKRPYQTLYYTGVHDSAAAHTSQGHCASDKGAIRASVVRIFMGEYGKAVIYDRQLGIPLYTVTVTPSEGLKVRYGAAVPRERWGGR